MQTPSLNLPTGAHPMNYHFLSMECAPRKHVGATLSAMCAQKLSVSNKQVWLLLLAVDKSLNPLGPVRQNFSGPMQKVKATNKY